MEMKCLADVSTSLHPIQTHIWTLLPLFLSADWAIYFNFSIAHVYSKFDRANSSEVVVF